MKTKVTREIILSETDVRVVNTCICYYLLNHGEDDEDFQTLLNMREYLTGFYFGGNMNCKCCEAEGKSHCDCKEWADNAEKSAMKRINDTMKFFESPEGKQLTKEALKDLERIEK